MENVVRLTALVVTGDVDGKLQRPLPSDDQSSHSDDFPIFYDIIVVISIGVTVSIHNVAFIGTETIVYRTTGPAAAKNDE